MIPSHIYLWGNKKNFTLSSASQGGYVLSETTITLCYREQHRPTSVEQLKRMIRRLYLQECYLYAQKRIPYWTTVLGVELKKVSIRRLKSLWGSCSPHNKTIRLNLCLAIYPHQFADYVILHECLHLIEPNHGPMFKSLLSKYMPHWKSIHQIPRQKLYQEVFYV
ncbi:MAG: M48 family metallopeptidase [Bdellovibrionaceae bacterium]|nr:M48 family metallopeptidase [Pseudobdellovibrionaceae bacterium]MDW8190928.1 DUF45 domain-containing protein [Pseudobdellovibrionaceae bacterium]